jgi:hypothetical protein
MLSDASDNLSGFLPIRQLSKSILTKSMTKIQSRLITDKIRAEQVPAGS